MSGIFLLHSSHECTKFYTDPAYNVEGVLKNKFGLFRNIAKTLGRHKWVWPIRCRCRILLGLR